MFAPAGLGAIDQGYNEGAVNYWRTRALEQQQETDKLLGNTWQAMVGQPNPIAQGTPPPMASPPPAPPASMPMAPPQPPMMPAGPAGGGMPPGGAPGGPQMMPPGGPGMPSGPPGAMPLPGGPPPGFVNPSRVAGQPQNLTGPIIPPGGFGPMGPGGPGGPGPGAAPPMAGAPQPGGAPSARPPAQPAPQPAGPSPPPAGPAAMTPGRGPPQLGSMSIKELATIIVGANPGAPPEAIARAMTKAMPFLTAQDQQYWRQAEYELQRENLAERSRRDDMYMESIRQKPATAAATAAARQTPFQKAFAKFQEEHPEATAKELQDFANDPATQKLDAAQKRTETTAAGAKERVGMQQTGATERTGMQQAGAAARNAATNVSRENTARQSFEFKTDAFNRNYEQRDRQFAEKQTLARQKVEGGTPKEGDIENVAQGIANYRQAPYTGIAARSAAGLRVMDRVYQLNKGYDAANWRAHSDGITRFTSGVQGNTIRSLRVADDHLKTLSVLAAQLENGDARSFNTVKNFITKQMGYPEVTNLDTARQIVAAEVIKAVSATGGGVRERLEAAGQLDKTASLAQINGAIGTYRRLMAGQLRGFKAQYEQIPGNPKNFEEQFEFDPKMLSPEETSLGGAAPAKSGAKDQERGGTEGWSIQPIK